MLLLKKLFAISFTIFNGVILCKAEENRSRQLIIGGEEVEVGGFEWFVAGDDYSGVLVAPEFFVTKYKFENKTRTVRVGALCRDSSNCGQQYEDRSWKEVFVHPNKKLMLVQLNEASSITPAQMDDGELAASYKSGKGNLWVAGFGYTSLDPEIIPSRLMQLENNFVTARDCAKQYKSAHDSQYSLLCAQNTDPLKSACFQDGGGPLYDSIADKLVGITHTGPRECAHAPVAYTSIGAEFQWLKSTICDHSDPKPDICFKKFPQREYFQIVSNYIDGSDMNWCLSPLWHGERSELTVNRCDADIDLQLWKIDERGLLRAKSNDTLCLKNVQKQQKFRMIECPDEGDKLPYALFVYDPIHKSLIWLKSEADFVQYGLRAVTIMSTPSEDRSAQERKVYVTKRNDRNILQKWSIFYPDL